MEPIKINNNKALIIAHRGLSGIEVENTCASFSLAASKSYFGIETDVHVTKDNKFIICHDDSTKRLSGIDKIIENSTYDEIRSLPIYNKEGKYDDNLFFPNLYEYISICKNNNKTCVLVIKNIMKKEHLQNMVIYAQRLLLVTRMNNPLEKWTECLYSDFMKEIQPVNIEEIPYY